MDALDSTIRELVVIADNVDVVCGKVDTVDDKAGMVVVVGGGVVSVADDDCIVVVRNTHLPDVYKWFSAHGTHVFPARTSGEMHDKHVDESHVLQPSTLHTHCPFIERYPSAQVEQRPFDRHCTQFGTLHRRQWRGLSLAIEYPLQQTVHTGDPSEMTH